jgi:hypothetical protein
MSKFIILAGMIFSALSGILFFWGGPDLQIWVMPAVNLAIILTVGGTILLILRRDW